MAYSPFQNDDNGVKIPSVNSIVSIHNIAINSDTYVAITVTGVYCKSVMLQTRDGEPFLLSTTSAGTTYATITQPLGLDIVGYPTKVIGYAKATVAGTLEVILLD